MEINRQSAISKFNFLSAGNIPFLFAIDFSGENCLVEALDDIDSSEIRFWINGKTNDTIPKVHWPEVVLEKSPMAFGEYKTAFNIVQQHINQGNSFLTNLTAETPIRLNIGLEDIFRFSEARYKLWWKDRFVCFSPEIFVQIDENGRMSSFPMKGTIDAALPDAETVLLNDKKELHEHTTIVDLIRNDVSSVAEKVWVEQFRYIDTIKTQDQRRLLQVSSQISAMLGDQWREHLGEIVFGMLPAGSVTGAPKARTLDIISEAEKHTYLKTDGQVDGRGYYTGVFGIFDGTKLDSGVMIRFIEQKNNGSLTYKSGGGITAASDAMKEYEELIQKIYVPIVRNHQVAQPETAQSCISS